MTKSIILELELTQRQYYLSGCTCQEKRKSQSLKSNISQKNFSNEMLANLATKEKIIIFKKVDVC